MFWVSYIVNESEIKLWHQRFKLKLEFFEINFRFWKIFNKQNTQKILNPVNIAISD